MDSLQTSHRSREIAVTALAVVGFVALVGGGLWLALYSTRFVPGVVNRFGSAAVYVTSLFSPAPPSLTVVPTPVATSTLPFPIATTTPNVASTTLPAPVIQKPTPPAPAPTSGTPTSSTYVIGGTTSTPINYYGLPDLVVSLRAGYVTSNATSTLKDFVATSTVPVGYNPAIHVVVKNIGTNISGPWRIKAILPTQSGYIQEWNEKLLSIDPGESRDYLLSFDYISANKGSGQMVSVTANFDRAITESNSNNNSAATYLTIMGS